VKFLGVQASLTNFADGTSQPVVVVDWQESDLDLNPRKSALTLRNARRYAIMMLAAAEQAEGAMTPKVGL
jgi:hypothetical protein